MQIKVNHIKFNKNLKAKSRAFTDALLSQIEGLATQEMSEVSKQVPKLTTSLARSYSSTGVRRVNKSTIRFGSNSGNGGGYKPIVYAGWIETGKRKVKKGTVKRKGKKGTVKRIGSKGIGSFKRARGRVIKGLPKAVKRAARIVKL